MVLKLGIETQKRERRINGYSQLANRFYDVLILAT